MKQEILSRVTEYDFDFISLIPFIPAENELDEKLDEFSSWQTRRETCNDAISITPKLLLLHTHTHAKDQDVETVLNDCIPSFPD